MPKTHPVEKVLSRFSQGKLPRRQNVKIAWHLYHCAPCREQVAQLAPESEELLADLFAGFDLSDASAPPSPPASGSRRQEYDRAFSQSWGALEIHGDDHQRERERAPVLFEELMRHPVSRRRPMVERTFRFQSYAFGEHLLARAHQEVYSNPFHAEDLTFLALQVAEALEGRHHGGALLQDLRARAWGYIGNARRVYGDFPAAEQAFQNAAEHHQLGTGDPLIEARLLTLRGSLRRHQERFTEAAKLLIQARTIYERAGESHWRGRTLLCHAFALVEAGDAQEAAALLEKAFAEVDFEREPHLRISAKSTAIHTLLALGKLEEAAVQLTELRQLTAEHGGDLDTLREEWLAGKVALALGQNEEAAARLAVAHQGFGDKRLDFEAARVARDLERVAAVAAVS